MPDTKCQILVVEDNVFIAMEMEYLVEDCGCVVVGPCSNLAEAMATARDAGLDAAVIDVNLGEDRIWPLADLLEERRVPFILATGYTSNDVPDRFKERPLLSKPLHPHALESALASLGLGPG